MFNGQQHMLLMSESQADLEYDDITVRFKTLEPNGLILALRDDASNQRKKDSMEVSLSRSGIMISVSIAGSKKTSEWEWIRIAKNNHEFFWRKNNSSNNLSNSIDLLVLISIIAGFETLLTAGSGLDDNQWHTLHIIRYNQVKTRYKVQQFPILFIDFKLATEIVYFSIRFNINANFKCKCIH